MRPSFVQSRLLDSLSLRVISLNGPRRRLGCHRLICIILCLCKYACKEVCDAKSRIDPCPLLARSWNR